MNMLASGFENFINGIFANWQMLLFVLAAILLLTAIAFRKFKLATLILVLVAAGIGVALLVDLVVKAIHWDLPDLVAFLVKWVPTVLFTATVLLATLIGLKRGLRKSLILLAHEVAVAAVCIIAYAVLVKLPAVDGFVLKVVDFFMGGDGSLAATLGVSADCDGIREVFVEWLPTVINGDFSIMLGESKAYIYTLADLIYRVAFALLLYIVFLILDFVMYVIYLCCYSERKYKAKIQKKYVENKVDRRYSKHHTGGGVVGLVRGVAIGLISMSFLGTALYIVAGRGDGKLKDYDFGDSNLNKYYSVYRSIDSYGTYGIFKVLNSISSTEDVPYYLFAADLVFSGELDDDEFGVSGNMVLREELAAYTCFARDTMELLLKYGGDEIVPLIKGEVTNGAFDKVVGVLTDEPFRAEFNDLISEFDSKTYVINFAMSFVNSAIANIDDMSFAPSVSAENKELLKIMFTKGYLSDAIPDERLLKETFDGVNLQVVQPYINISKLVNKNDVQIIYNLVLDVLGRKTSTTDDVLKLTADMLSQIKQLSLIDESRAEELDPVRCRMYCYAVNRYLTEEGGKEVYYSDIYRDDIDWTGEINAFLDVSEASLKLYGNVSSVKKPIDALIAIFDKSNPDYNENIAYYDSITNCILSSRIIGKTLATSGMYRLLENGLSTLFEGIYIPRDIVYETTYDANGVLLHAGEMYNVLNGLGAIGKNSDLLPMLQNFDKDRDLETFLKSMTDAIHTQDENGNTLAEYIVRSDLLRSVISAAVINYGGDYAYVPTAAREKNADGVPVKFIKAAELTSLFDNLSEIVDFILPVLQDENADLKSVIVDFVTNKRDVFDNLINGSTIFEGTVGLHLVNALKDDETVVIPQSLKDNLDGWATANGKKGEIKNLLGALEAAGIEIADVINGTLDADSIFDKFTSEEFTDENLQTCLKSGVLHYTVSKFLTNGNNDFGSFKLIVPEAAQKTLEGDSLSALVLKDEIQNVLRVVKNFGLSEETDVSSVLVKLVQEENKQMLADSYILSASVVCSLVENPDVGDLLNIPVKFKEAATEAKLKKFNSSNPWKTEILRLIDALDEIMGISSAEEFTFDEDKLTESLSSFLKDMNGASSINENVSRLTVCYASEVVRGNITVRLDELLEGNVEESLLYGAKSGGYYTENELRSLSNVLTIFDIDVMNIDADALTTKIKDEILHLNDAAPEGFSGSKLDATYPSVIFSGIMSSALDDVLLNSEDEEGNPAPLIDKQILYKIKAGSQRYRQELIEEVIDSINGLGIKDFEELNNLNVNEAINKIEDMDAVCKSVLMRGVFTKQIKDNDTLGVDHPLAYEEEIKIIKANEIKAVINLIGKINDVEETYFDTVPLNDIRSNLFNDDRTVKSYLILSAVSDSIVDSAHLIVDKALIDRYDCVDSEEVWRLCEAFVAMFGGDASIYTLGESGFAYPTPEQRVVAMDSRIVRAKLTAQLIEENKAGKIYVSAENFTPFTDTKGTAHGVISYGEMNAVFDVIDACGGKDFTIPVINNEKLKEYYYNNLIDMMFTTDILRYKICDYVLSRISVENAMEERAYDIAELEAVTKYVIDVEEVKQAIAKLS